MRLEDNSPIKPRMLNLEEQEELEAVRKDGGMTVTEDPIHAKPNFEMSKQPEQPLDKRTKKIQERVKRSERQSREMDKKEENDLKKEQADYGSGVNKSQLDPEEIKRRKEFVQSGMVKRKKPKANLDWHDKHDK